MIALISARLHEWKATDELVPTECTRTHSIELASALDFFFLSLSLFSSNFSFSLFFSPLLVDRSLETAKEAEINETREQD